MTLRSTRAYVLLFSDDVVFLSGAHSDASVGATVSAYRGRNAQGQMRRRKQPRLSSNMHKPFSGPGESIQQIRQHSPHSGLALDNELLIRARPGRLPNIRYPWGCLTGTGPRFIVLKASGADPVPGPDVTALVSQMLDSPHSVLVPRARLTSMVERKQDVPAVHAVWHWVSEIFQQNQITIIRRLTVHLRSSGLARPRQITLHQGTSVW